MKKNLLIVLVVVAVAGCFWVLVRRIELRPRGNDGTKTSVTGGHTNAGGVIEVEPVTPLTNRVAEFKKPAGVDERQWQTLLQIRRELLNQNKAIQFHARVIDQFGQPVSGAVAKGKLSRNDEEKLSAENFIRFKPGEEIVHEPLELTSDSDGWIRLTGRRGRFIVIESLNRPSYTWRFEKYLNFDYDRPNRSEDFKDASKGYVFHLWKQGTTEVTRPVALGINMDQEVQGRWVSNYFVSFFQNTATISSFPSEDVQVLGIRHETGIPNRPYEFTITLVVPKGGLVESADVYPFHAPDSGYQPSWTFVNKPMTRGPEDQPWTKSFYFKLREGRAFAGARVSFQRNGFNLVFEGNLNPNGSRNLEPDPEKHITDPEEIRRLDEATRAK